jgi:hypothetical protein
MPQVTIRCPFAYLGGRDEVGSKNLYVDVACRRHLRFFIAPYTQRPDTQVQTQSQPEPEGLPLHFIKSGFGCDERYVAEGIGTMKDELKALNWLIVEKKEGNCIGFEAGETVYVDGAPLKIRNGLVQVRPPHCAGYPANGCKKEYWTALGLLGSYDKESNDKKKGKKKGNQ